MPLLEQLPKVPVAKKSRDDVSQFHQLQGQRKMRKQHQHKWIGISVCGRAFEGCLILVLCKCPLYIAMWSLYVALGNNVASQICPKGFSCSSPCPWPWKSSS